MGCAGGEQDWRELAGLLRARGLQVDDVAGDRGGRPADDHGNRSVGGLGASWPGVGTGCDVKARRLEGLLQRRSEIAAAFSISQKQLAVRALWSLAHPLIPEP